MSLLSSIRRLAPACGPLLSTFRPSPEFCGAIYSTSARNACLTGSVQPASASSVAASAEQRRGFSSAKAAETEKPPLTAYIRYASATRQKVIAENPGIAFGDVGRKLGERWRGLSDAEKKPYLDAYAAEKRAYDAKKKTV